MTAAVYISIDDALVPYGKRRQYLIVYPHVEFDAISTVCQLVAPTYKS